MYLDYTVQHGLIIGMIRFHLGYFNKDGKTLRVAKTIDDIMRGDE